MGKQQNGLARRCDIRHGNGLRDGAELAHILHHSLHIFDRRAGNDAVAQIEDVSRTAAGLLEDLAHALAEQISAGEQQDGVEIALHRDRVAESGPALVQGHPPIEADDVGAGFAHGRQQGRGIHAEVDDRHAQRLHLAH